MANNIQPYNPFWYAQKMVTALEPKLSFTRTLSRDFDREPRAVGDTIKFKRPGRFQARPMPSAVYDDVNPSEDQIKLDKWWGVQFKLRDDELTFTGEEIIRHHVDPAMTALSQAIELSAIGLYKDVPHVIEGAQDSTDFTRLRRKMNDRNVSQSGRILALNNAQEEAYNNLDLFTSAHRSSDGGQTQREGTIGPKWGFNAYSAPLFGDHVPGVLTVTTGPLRVASDAAKGTSTIVLNATALTGTVKQGDTVTIAGLAYPVAVAADAAASGNSITLQLAQPLAAAIVATAAASVRQQAKGVNLAYDPAAFAIVMAPLTMAGDGKGAEIGTAINEATGVAVRAMRWYDANEVSHKMRFDALWGVKTVDANKAHRLEGLATAA